MYLVFLEMNDSEIVRKLAAGSELIRLVDERDFQGYEIVKILDITKPNNIFEIKYAGWQPGCLIEFKDPDGNTVLSGYGTDH